MLSTSTVPRALVALVTMQNVNKASQLEKIFRGDKSEYLRAGQQVEDMRAQFEHGQYLKESFGFDENAFRFLAKHYLLFPDGTSRDEISETSGASGAGGAGGHTGGKTSMSFAQLCAHNALAAFVTGNTHLCQMWRILEVLYANEEMGSGQSKLGERAADGKQSNPENPFDDAFDRHNSQPGMSMDGAGHEQQNPMMTLDRLGGTNPEHQVGGAVSRQDGSPIDEFGNEGYNNNNNPSETAMLLEQLDHVNPQAMEGFDPYPYDPSGRLAHENGREGGDRNGAVGVTNMRGNSSTIVHGSAVLGELGHLRDDVLKELLEYYTNIGDLQSCVAIAVVVGKVSNVEKVMSKAWLQHIYMHYIDLLHQLQIYTTANELVSNCSDQSIRQMNMVTNPRSVDSSRPTGTDCCYGLFSSS
ncbi:hypothetical protein BBJ28_00000330 [Nothophytophthora sp. Chile5]|nr:hypothetical protein BBJ28_00000330 [Nothophytophthora sp. Chile5]